MFILLQQTKQTHKNSKELGIAPFYILSIWNTLVLEIPNDYLLNKSVENGSDGTYVTFSSFQLSWPWKIKVMRKYPNCCLWETYFVGLLLTLMSAWFLYLSMLMNTRVPRSLSSQAKGQGKGLINCSQKRNKMAGWSLIVDWNVNNISLVSAGAGQFRMACFMSKSCRLTYTYFISTGRIQNLPI